MSRIISRSCHPPNLNLLHVKCWFEDHQAFPDQSQVLIWSLLAHLIERTKWCLPATPQLARPVSLTESPRVCLLLTSAQLWEWTFKSRLFELTSATLPCNFGTQQVKYFFKALKLWKVEWALLLLSTLINGQFHLACPRSRTIPVCDKKLFPTRGWSYASLRCHKWEVIPFRPAVDWGRRCNPRSHIIFWCV